MLCLGGRGIGFGRGIGSGEAIARDAFDDDPIFDRVPASGCIAVYDGAATYGIVEGIAVEYC